MVYVYAVFGTTEFPSDMLRYDQAVILGGPFKREQLPGMVDLPDNGNIYLLVSRTLPATGRWHSFLWGVSTDFKTRRQVRDEEAEAARREALEDDFARK